jgi:preprotein translocase subunit Sec61beta
VRARSGRFETGTLAATGIVRWCEEFDGWAIVIDMHKITELPESQNLSDDSIA